MSEDELRAQARHAWLLAKTWPSEEEKIECIYLNLRAAVEAERMRWKRVQENWIGRCACRFDDDDNPITQCNWHQEQVRAAVEAEREACLLIAETNYQRADIVKAIRRRTDNG